MKKSGRLDIRQIPAVETARQITLIEHELLRRIKHTELLSRKWEDARHAPNISMFIAFCNRLSEWVTTEIVKGKKPTERGETISYFIAVAKVSPPRRRRRTR